MNTSKNRREFIYDITHQLLALSSLPALAACVNPFGSKTIAATSESARFKLLELPNFTFLVSAPSNQTDENSDLLKINSKTNKIERLTIPVKFAHGIELNPIYKNIAVIIGLDSPHAAIVDFEKMKVIKTIVATQNSWFPGHALYSKDAKHIYLPEYKTTKDQNGFISVLNTKTFKIEAQFPSHFIQPHDIVYIDNATNLAVGHYGNQFNPMELTYDGGLSILNAKTGTLVNKTQPADKNISLCHLGSINENEIIASTRKWKNVQTEKESNHKHGPNLQPQFHYGSALYSYSAKSGLNKINPSWLLPEMRLNFTVCKHPTLDIFAVNHLAASATSFWDAKAFKLLKAYSYPSASYEAAVRPTGIQATTNGSHFVIQTNFNKCWLFSAKDLVLDYVHTFPEGTEKLRTAGPHFKIIS